VAIKTNVGTCHAGQVVFVITLTSEQDSTVNARYRLKNLKPARIAPAITC